MIAGGTPSAQRAKPGTVGRAYTHVSIRILDDDGRELPADRPVRYRTDPQHDHRVYRPGALRARQA